MYARVEFIVRAHQILLAGFSLAFSANSSEAIRLLDKFMIS